LDFEFASVFRLKGEMGVPPHVSPLETTILNSRAFGKICIFFHWGPYIFSFSATNFIYKITDIVLINIITVHYPGVSEK